MLSLVVLAQCLSVFICLKPFRFTFRLSSEPIVLWRQNIVLRRHVLAGETASK